MPKTAKKDTHKALQGHAGGDLAAQLALIDRLSDSANRNDADMNKESVSEAIEERKDLLETLATMQRAATVNDAHVQVLMVAKHLITLSGVLAELEHDNDRANTRGCSRYECISALENKFAHQERTFKQSLQAVNRLVFSLNAYFRAQGSTVPAALVDGYLPDQFDPVTLERKAIARAKPDKVENGRRRRG